MATDLQVETVVAAIEMLDGDRWHSQYRLEPGRRVLIGRDETNHFRVNDESCSRTHCELFQSGERWILRDAKSRNGTRIDGNDVKGDVALTHGQVFELGKTRMRFLEAPEAEFPSDLSNTDPSLSIPSFPNDAAELLREAEGSVFHHSPSESKDWDAKSQPVLALLPELYRIATMIATASTIRGLSETALEALLRHTSADFGGVLLLPSTKSADRKPEKLEIKAFRTKRDVPYARVSEAISRYVLEAAHGVHWKSVSGAEGIGTADSVNELEVRSAACVPLKFDDRIAGLIHLYSKDSSSPITSTEFEFMLAVGEQVSATLRHLVESKHLGEKLKKAQALVETIQEQTSKPAEIIGDSEAMQKLRVNIARVAPTDATVLVRGESGVGKELVAQAMHSASGRLSKPFVCMNCAALSESLLESELFGHEKGSFTGATGKKIGKFEQADGGTLLLDEVGEMSLAIQAKFLRVLEGHPFERVGGTQSIDVDVRLVAATNRDLEEAVRAGTFRRDLYFRLQVLQIDIPPLRDRSHDIPLLAQFFIEKFRRRLGRHVKGLSAAASTKLRSYHWPGNIRELQNTIERAVILCNDEVIGPDDILLSELDDCGSTPEVAEIEAAAFAGQSIEEMERSHVLRTLDALDWNKTKAAQLLGIERSTLDRKLKRYGVSRPTARA